MMDCDWAYSKCCQEARKTEIPRPAKFHSFSMSLSLFY